MTDPRIACVHLPHIATALEVRDNRALADRPIVVEAPQPMPRIVYDVSDLAQRLGIHRGMSLTQARKICPELTVLPARLEVYRDTYQVLLELLAELVPAVEPADPERSWLTATGLIPRGSAECTLATEMARRIRHEIGLPSRVGMAHGKLTSKIVTQYLISAEVMVLPRGTEVRFLSGLATRYLPLSASNHRQLRLLGLVKVYQYAALPASGILPRFGYDGLRAYRLAHGADDAQVHPWQAEPFLEARQTFDEPIATQPLLRRCLEQLAQQIARPLAARYQMASAISLALAFENGETLRRERTLIEPVVHPQRLLTHADSLASTISWPAPVERITLAVRGLCPTLGRQLDLFRQHHQERSPVEAALKRIQRRYGAIVHQGHVLATDAPLPERRAYLTPWPAA